MKNRICTERTTGKLIEFQQGDAPLGTLEANAITSGYSAGEVEEAYTDLGIQEAMLAHESTADTATREAREARVAQRAQDVSDSLPSWQQVSDAIDGAFPAGAQRTVVKRLARVVYWLAKNTSS